jgi:hypothetical protein
LENIMRCINLRKRFPDCKITHDPATEDRRDAWLMQIPCRFGIIYPHGGDQLAVEVDGHPSAVKRLTAMDLLHQQNGDGEHTFIFHVDAFDSVAAVVLPRRKRRYSPATLEQMKSRLALVRAGKP